MFLIVSLLWVVVLVWLAGWRRRVAIRAAILASLADGSAPFLELQQRLMSAGHWWPAWQIGEVVQRLIVAGEVEARVVHLPIFGSMGVQVLALTEVSDGSS